MADNTWLLALQQMDPNEPGGKYQAQMQYLKDNVPQAEWDAAVQKGWISQDGKPLNIPQPGGRQQSDANWNVDSTKFIDQHQGSWEAMDTYDDPVYGKMTSRKTPSLESSRKMNIWGPLAALGPGMLGAALAGAGGAAAAGAAGAGAAEGGVAGSIYGGMAGPGAFAGWTPELAAAAGAGGAGSAGGAALNTGFAGAGAESGGMLASTAAAGGGPSAGGSMLSNLASSLGLSPSQAAGLIKALPELAGGALGAIGANQSGKIAEGAVGADIARDDARYQSNVAMTHPNQTNAFGDTNTWAKDENGNWSNTQKLSEGRQQLYDTQQGIAQSNATTAAGIDLSGYKDPNKQFAAAGAANPYQTKLPSMGGNLIPWDYKSQLGG